MSSSSSDSDSDDNGSQGGQRDDSLTGFDDFEISVTSGGGGGDDNGDFFRKKKQKLEKEIEDARGLFREHDLRQTILKNRKKREELEKRTQQLEEDELERLQERKQKQREEREEEESREPRREKPEGSEDVKIGPIEDIESIEYPFKDFLRPDGIAGSTLDVDEPFGVNFLKSIHERITKANKHPMYAFLSCVAGFLQMKLTAIMEPESAEIVNTLSRLAEYIKKVKTDQEKRETMKMDDSERTEKYIQRLEENRLERRLRRNKEDLELRRLEDEAIQEARSRESEILYGTSSYSSTRVDFPELSSGYAVEPSPRTLGDYVIPLESLSRKPPSGSSSDSDDESLAPNRIRPIVTQPVSEPQTTADGLEQSRARTVPLLVQLEEKQRKAKEELARKKKDLQLRELEWDRKQRERVREREAKVGISGSGLGRLSSGKDDSSRNRGKSFTRPFPQVSKTAALEWLLEEYPDPKATELEIINMMFPEEKAAPAEFEWLSNYFIGGFAHVTDPVRSSMQHCQHIVLRYLQTCLKGKNGDAIEKLLTWDFLLINCKVEFALAVAHDYRINNKNRYVTEADVGNETRGRTTECERVATKFIKTNFPAKYKSLNSPQHIARSLGVNRISPVLARLLENENLLFF